MVAMATRVVRDGGKSLIDAIRAGKVTVSDAAGILSFSSEEQRAAAEAVLSGKARTLRTAAKHDWLATITKTRKKKARKRRRR
jgi:hypothetical protein